MLITVQAQFSMVAGCDEKQNGKCIVKPVGVGEGVNAPSFYQTWVVTEPGHSSDLPKPEASGLLLNKPDGIMYMLDSQSDGSHAATLNFNPVYMSSGGTYDAGTYRYTVAVAVAEP